MDLNQGTRWSLSFSESNSAIESFEQDNGSADGDSGTEECPNQKIFSKTDGLEFRIARNRFRRKNEADGRGRLKEQCGQYKESFQPTDIQASVNHFLVLLCCLPFLVLPKGADECANEIAAAKDHKDIDDAHQENAFLEEANSIQQQDERLERRTNKEKYGSDDSDEMECLIEYEREGIVGYPMRLGERNLGPVHE